MIFMNLRGVAVLELDGHTDHNKGLESSYLYYIAEYIRLHDLCLEVL